MSLATKEELRAACTQVRKDVQLLNALKNEPLSHLNNSMLPGGQLWKQFESICLGLNTRSDVLEKLIFEAIDMTEKAQERKNDEMLSEMARFEAKFIVMAARIDELEKQVKTCTSKMVQQDLNISEDNGSVRSRDVVDSPVSKPMDIVIEQLRESSARNSQIISQPKNINEVVTTKMPLSPTAAEFKPA